MCATATGSQGDPDVAPNLRVVRQLESSATALRICPLPKAVEFLRLVQNNTDRAYLEASCSADDPPAHLPNQLEPQLLPPRPSPPAPLSPKAKCETCSTGASARSIPSLRTQRIPPWHEVRARGLEALQFSLLLKQTHPLTVGWLR